MNLEDRRKRYSAIETARKRPLIVYATSTRPGLQTMMAADVVRELIDQLDSIKSGDSVDILLHSAGGDALAAWKLMSVLRERFKNVAVLVPFMAFSAATIFSLGADEIVLHPHSSLGPIDPQITVGEGKRRFSYEDVGAFLRFLSDEVRITEQAYVSALVDKLFSAVDPLIVGASKRASELSSAVGERLLLLHATGPEAKTRARQLADNLNKSFFDHGDAVSRSRGRQLLLQIAKDDPKLEGLMWDAYLGLEQYMKLREPFLPLQMVMADPAAAASLQPLAPLRLPSNAPAGLQQQLWNAAGQQAIQTASGAAPSVDYETVNAVVESVRAASEHRTVGKMTGIRLPNGEVQVSVLPTAQSWRQVG